MAQEGNSKTLKGRMRRIAKSIVIRGGGLSLYHRAKHREVLTVLMLHRVLPQDLITPYRADEGYTISTTLLEGLIAFVADHYNFVSLDDVLQSRQKTKPLPPHPLLVTFDDGWNDNAVFASEASWRRQKSRGQFFAATDAAPLGARWWQESLLAILRSDDSAFDKLKDAALVASNHVVAHLPSDRALAILVLYGGLPAAQRDDLIASQASSLARESAARDMVDWETLARLQSSGVCIGGHGASHLPLTMINDPINDLQKAHDEMRQHLGDPACYSMSFPHGRYNAAIVQHALEHGRKTDVHERSDPQQMPWRMVAI